MATPRGWTISGFLRRTALFCAAAKMLLNLGLGFAFAGKSTLWTDAGVDQNFQRQLGAIGPYEFQRKFIWTNPLVPCFQGKSVWTDGPESLSKFPSRLVLVHRFQFGEGARGLCRDGSTRLVALAQHAVAPGNISFAQAQATFRRLFVLRGSAEQTLCTSASRL